MLPWSQQTDLLGVMRRHNQLEKTLIIQGMVVHAPGWCVQVLKAAAAVTVACQMAGLLSEDGGNAMCRSLEAGAAAIGNCLVKPVAARDVACAGSVS